MDKQAKCPMPYGLENAYAVRVGRNRNEKLNSMDDDGVDEYARQYYDGRMVKESDFYEESP